MVGSGCMLPFTPPPSNTTEIALYAFPTISFTNGSHTYAFDVNQNFSYLRTALTAVRAANVDYNATAPNGTAYVSSIRTTYPFVEELRVSDPGRGRWHLTMRATTMEDGSLQILVPESEVQANSSASTLS
ncbi:MAG: hypothetical protein ACYDDF_13260 [Thermoplasmatota archaeon]